MSLLLLPFFLIGAVVRGVVLDLTPIPRLTGTAPTVSLPEATFTCSPTGCTSFDFPPLSATPVLAMCSLMFGTRCEGDFTLEFTHPVSNFRVTSGGFDPSDIVLITGFDVHNQVVGSQSVAADQVTDLSSFGAIKKLIFDDSSFGSGFAFFDFTFDIAGRAVGDPATRT